MSSVIGWPSVMLPPLDDRRKERNCVSVLNALKEKRQSVSKKYGSEKESWNSCRSLEICADSDTDCPRPRKLSCAICAVAMKLSALEKPAPIWNVPVAFSLI